MCVLKDTSSPINHLSPSAVAECKPALDDKVLSALVEQLNSSDQLSSFCKALRQQFCQLVS